MSTQRLIFLIAISALLGLTVVALRKPASPVERSAAHAEERESNDAALQKDSSAQTKEPEQATKSEGSSGSTAPPTEMLRLATESDFAIVGTLVRSEGIVKRLSDEELTKLDDLNKAVGGIVYIFHVEDVVIKRADFGGAANRMSIPVDNLLIFKRRGAGDPYSPNELYVYGKRYLIFVKAFPDPTKLMKDYKLDEKKTYYQAFEPNKGVMLVESNPQQFLLNLKQFGDAVKSPDPRTKLQKLKVLSNSPDPELKQTATAAIKLIHQKFHQ